jgi:hypothetical protein
MGHDARGRSVLHEFHFLGDWKSRRNVINIRGAMLLYKLAGVCVISGLSGGKRNPPLRGKLG